MKIEQVKNLEPIARLTYWIKERESIRLNKEAGEPRPWTDDEILDKYRFCNVRREEDKVTKWISDNWRTPNEAHPNLWFAMVMARMLNLPNSLQAVGFPYYWNVTEFVEALTAISESGRSVFNGAYMVRNDKGISKIRYVAERVLDRLWSARSSMSPVQGDSLDAYYTRLMTGYGVGSFMVGQVIADLKYAPPLDSAPDWYTFAVPGPGSLRGLNRVLLRPCDQAWIKSKWVMELIRLSSNRLILPFELHNQDLQSCLCEFDKYERALWGQGKPKQLYRG